MITTIGQLNSLDGLLITSNRIYTGKLLLLKDMNDIKLFMVVVKRKVQLHLQQIQNQPHLKKKRQELSESATKK